jgi:diguanylate cyclase (GGDEF)-like protein
VANNTEDRHQKLEPISGRTTARFGVAAAVVLVAAAGVWGAIASVEGMRGYRHAQRVESALEQARYALAVERSSTREPNVATGRRDLQRAATTFGAQLTRLADSGGGGDAATAAALRARHGRLVQATAGVFALRSGVDPTAADRLLTASVDPQMLGLDTTLVRLLAGIRGKGADAWPTRPLQEVQLGAVALLVALGLASAAIYLLRLGGYRRRLMRERREKIAALEEAALSDSLTRLGNHRAFHDDLKREIARRARTGSCFSVVMLDLDGLKQINDSLGHQAGDDRIRAVAASLRATLRGSDGAYRTGGDEFMVLLPGERAFGGLTFAQRLQSEVVKAGKAVGVSCGVVESDGLESARSLMRRVDLALYEAKRTGRRIVVYTDGISPRPADRPEDLALRRHHRLLATALAQAVDAKDAGTRNHCETVSALCVLIGEALGLGGERLEQIRLAGLLHDVGKIGIADALLQKPRSLDDDERTVMSGHVAIGHAIVAAAGLGEEADWILHHHEHFDGSGYPDSLGGTAIPLESRIILVADAFEAMTADRPYRAARVPDEAFREIERAAGTQFDPSCVEALRAVLDNDDHGIGRPENKRKSQSLATVRNAPGAAAQRPEPKVASA